MSRNYQQGKTFPAIYTVYMYEGIYKHIYIYIEDICSKDTSSVFHVQVMLEFLTGFKMAKQGTATR